MTTSTLSTPKMPRSLLTYPTLLIAVGFMLVNFIAIFQIDFFHIGSFLSFTYILIIPGFLVLPFLSEKKLPAALAIALSVALSCLTLMLLGLVVNTVLPFFGNTTPLTTIPLLIAFDFFIGVAFFLYHTRKKELQFEYHPFTTLNWILGGILSALPILSCLGAIILNNNGSNFLTMFVLGIVFILVPIIVLTKDKIDSAIYPLTLYMTGLAFLLMNSMRGWFITGHDILLEYHVFSLTDTAHLWSMAFYHDPYMACLSLTILPTFLQSLMHLSVNSSYMFKFLTQFIGALPVVIVYYLTKEYTSEKIAFLAGFLYITFPTFMVDMAFLNRQGIAFLFFGALIFVMLTDEYFSGWKRTLALFLLGTGVVISHYSTSYVAISILLATYIINRIIRFLMGDNRPKWLSNFSGKLANKEMRTRPILLTLPFVIGLLCIMVVWSTFITKTSNSLINTIQQIVTNIEHPFSLDGYSGPAKYSLLQSEQPTPEELFNTFLKQGIKDENISANPSEYYPLSLTESYPATPIAEQFAALTNFGEKLQSFTHINLADFYAATKQIYAKVIQVFLLIGLVGIILGYSFKKNLLHHVPIEYIALSIAGIVVIVGQTILPASAIDYGLLRLFQQNLTFLVLPIILGFLYVSSLMTRDHQKQLTIVTVILLFFFGILSGVFPQLTGGDRSPLSLDNSGLYYDSYYTHAEEVYSANWLAANGNLELPIQAAHFSDIKMIAYGHIGSYIELLPETTKRESYVYLNYDNVKTSDILEIVNGDVVYYRFPMQFLQQNKNLIYNNGGSEIYR